MKYIHEIGQVKAEQIKKVMAWKETKEVYQELKKRGLVFEEYLDCHKGLIFSKDFSREQKQHNSGPPFMP